MNDDDRRPFSRKKRHHLPPEVYSEEGRRFFITTRALRGMAPFTTAERCEIVLEKLREQRLALNCWVGPYCLRPDHLHFICGPGPAGHSVLRLVHRLHGASTNALWKTNWSGRVWQPDCYDELLDAGAALTAAGEYLLLNPVRKGWVSAPEEWPWSGWIDDLDDPASSR